MSVPLNSHQGENDEVKQRKKTLKNNKMHHFFKDLFILFITLLSVYASIHKSWRGRGTGRPFFEDVRLRRDSSALVEDFYTGELGGLLAQVGRARLSFVFYYAPWDADSQTLRQDFLELAHFYQAQVYFAAVNCWEPEGECRSRFKEVVEHWPQLVAYLGRERAVTYRGPHSTDPMIHFLHSLLHPIVRLNHIAGLSKLRFIHDAVLVGYLELRAGDDTGLTELWETGLLLASSDLSRRTKVAVFTHSKFNSLLLSSSASTRPLICLYIRDMRITYEGPLSPSSLFRWLERLQSSIHISTHGLLPLKSPTVVLFTPLHPLARLTPTYFMFRRVALSLLTPPENATYQTDVSTYLSQQSSSLQEKFYADLVQEELELESNCLKTVWAGSQCPVATPRWLSNATCLPSRVSFRSEAADWLSELESEACWLLDRSPRLPPAAQLDLSSASVGAAAPSCRSSQQPLNISFSWAALDSALFGHLAAALGISLTPLSPTALLILGKEEMIQIHHVREEALWSALQNWSRGGADHPVLVEPGHQMVLPEDQLVIPEDQLVIPEDHLVHLPQLNLSTFSHLLHHNSKNCLILYKSAYCGLCGSASQLILQLAALTSSLGCLQVAALEGDRLPLPWHFSLHFFPSLLFIPKHKWRKSESRLYPRNSPWQLGPVSDFLLANLELVERPEVLLALCTLWGLEPESSAEGSDCVRRVRLMTLQGIGVTLRQARRRQDQRSHLLHQLTFLRAVHLLLFRVRDISRTLTEVRELSAIYRLGCSINS